MLLFLTLVVFASLRVVELSSYYSQPLGVNLALLPLVLLRGRIFGL